jgi:hypothetical protein
MMDRSLAGKMPALRQSIHLHQWDAPRQTAQMGFLLPLWTESFRRSSGNDSEGFKAVFVEG